MIALLLFALAILASPFKSNRRLAAENAALRQQLIVLRPQIRGRVTNNDRLFFVQLYRWFPSVPNVIKVKDRSRPIGGTAPLMLADNASFDISFQ
jgi:hypothetical protein